MLNKSVLCLCCMNTLDARTLKFPLSYVPLIGILLFHGHEVSCLFTCLIFKCETGMMIFDSNVSHEENVWIYDFQR